MQKISILDSFTATRTATDIYEQQVYYLLSFDNTTIPEKTVIISTK